MTTIFNKLREITAVLMDPVINYGAILNATASLKALFCEATVFKEDEPSNRENMITETGVAVGPWAAAFCINDMMRSRVFLMGLREAIEEQLTINNGRPVKVLYAGTGPFATLITPLVTFFTPQQLQVVMLEINPVSVDYLKRTIRQFNMEAYIIDILTCDASNYCIPEVHQPDILVTETMQAALQKEPQVAIVANLVTQCGPGIVLIPQSIQVEAALMGYNNENSLTVLPLKMLMELNAGTAAVIQKDHNSLPVFSEGINISIPVLPAGYSSLVLLTKLIVYREQVLQVNECGLTIPYQLADLGSIKEWPQNFRFKYRLGTKPGFVYTKT